MGEGERSERRFIADAKWNYEPASAERCEVVVPEWREGDPPLAWWKPLVGITVKAVLVRYYDQRHLLFDGDGSATNKVTHGGGPDMPSKHLPMRCWQASNPGEGERSERVPKMPDGWDLPCASPKDPRNCPRYRCQRTGRCRLEHGTDGPCLYCGDRGCKACDARSADA